MRNDSGWIDLQIRDLSDKGLMAEADAAPPRGHYIEIRRFGHTLIGVVVWSKSNRFGVSLSDKTDIDGLIEGGSTQRSEDRLGQERAKGQRTVVLTTPADWRWLGQAMERAVLLGIAVAGTLVLGSLVYEALATPAEQVAQGLRH